MDQKDNRKQIQNHILGIAGTLLFHGVLIFLFYMIVFHTPIPPWPEEGGGGGGNGLEINLGTSNEGMGADQFADISMPSFENRKVSEPVTPPSEQDVKMAKTQDEEVLTQDNEESVAVPSKTENTKKKTEKTTTVVKQPVKPAAPVQPVVNQNALYKKKSNNDGTTGKPGNQGREDGKTGSGNYGGTGTGKGTGDGSGTGSGSGSGSGSGIGSGTGGGVGSGISADLGGRPARSFGKPFYNSPEQGKIVVSIKVNKQGKVTYAAAGAKGTTISEIGLRQQAENAARKTVFAPDDNAPDEQRGTITYNFRKVK
jgi:outer membrane biosynthesis protein TonB